METKERKREGERHRQSFFNMKTPNFCALLWIYIQLPPVCADI